MSVTTSAGRSTIASRARIFGEFGRISSSAIARRAMGRVLLASDLVDFGFFFRVFSVRMNSKTFKREKANGRVEKGGGVLILPDLSLV